MKMEQIERIKKFEEDYDKCKEVLEDLYRAFEEYDEIKDSLIGLFNYYYGPVWMKDYQDDQNHLIPEDMKRGVLSEDAIDDLFLDHQELVSIMEKIVSHYKEPK